MRPFFLAPFLVASAAFADDFIVNPPVVSAVVYYQGATTLQQTTLALPAGRHRVLFPKPIEKDRAFEAITFTNGVVQLGSAYIQTDLDGKTLFSPAQSESRKALELAKTIFDDVQNEKTVLSNQIAALERQLAFLGSIGGGQTVTTPAADVLAMAKMIGGETASLLVEIAEIKTMLPALDDRIADAQRAVNVATIDFRATGPLQNVQQLMAIEVLVPEDTETTITVAGVEDAGWSPSYEFHLTRGDNPALTLKRDVAITLRSGVTWQDIDLTLSSANPVRRTSPGYIEQSLARIQKPQPEIRTMTKSLAAEADSFRPEPVVMAEASANLAGDDETVTYHFDQTVTVVGTDAPSTVLQLADLTFTPEIINQTHPKSDETAYVLAKFTNTSIDPIFGSEAAFYRDGVLIGREYIDTIPAKTEATLGFGPLDRIRVDHAYLNRETGDRGFLTTSNTRTEAIEFSVENLSDAPVDVRALYPLPYSEQEDLKITTTANPKADEVSIDNRRGVAGWHLALAAGEKKTVRLNFDLTWPEGYVLNWRP